MDKVDVWDRFHFDLGGFPRLVFSLHSSVDDRRHRSQDAAPDVVPITVESFVGPL